ncbi:MAG: hypothetical protein BWK76_05305 [Desulfobulbaceae bacterium A2]|nr:MAG: hypothetical protein BWK76_05305 [Desulfobulbaceae bacterium A2]
MPRQLSGSFFVGVGLFFLWLKLWLVSPHDIMATVTPHDDLLFINLAASLLSGDWLGDYNQLTLIKGPFYSMFIALVYWLNIPLLLAQQLLQAGAGAVFVLALRPLIRRSWLLLAVFFVLLFNPFSYNYPSVGRVLQLAIYPSLGLLVFGLALGLALRAGDSLRRGLPWALWLGLVTGLFWLTRDESVWIVPSLALLLLWSVGNALVRGRGWRGVALLHLLPATVWYGVLLLVCGLNYLYYGVFVRNELESPEFKAAYGGLLRIRTAEDRQYYPVVQAARRLGYEVSPALRELEPYLDGEIGNRWQRICACPDLPAAFFIWAFRDAVTAAGYHMNAVDTLAFYGRIGEEIDQACSQGRIECRPRLTSLMPPWRPEYNAQLLPIYGKLLRQIVTMNAWALTQGGLAAKVEGWRSQAPLPEMVLFESITRERVLPARKDVQETEPHFHRQLNREKTRLLDQIGRAYQRVVPYLFVVAFCLTVGTTLLDLRHRRLSPLPLCNWALLGGILAINAVITLVYITSYSEVGRAMTTAFPLVPAFILMAGLDLAVRLERREDDR